MGAERGPHDNCGLWTSCEANALWIGTAEGRRRRQSLTSTQVLRWSALGLGAIYGLTRQMSFNQEAKVNAEKRAYEHKQELINKARAEFEAKQNPSKGDGSKDSQPPG